MLAALLAVVLSVGAAKAQVADVVAPIGPGPFPAACSNVEQDFSRMLPGESADQYWEGQPRGGEGRYVTTLFRDPSAALQFGAAVPSNRDVFPRIGGTTVPYALVVCYPTDRSNARASYPLPNGFAVPRMQRGTETPIWPESIAATRLPLVLYAHGLGGSPLSGEYLSTATLLATWGFVVAAPFLADARFSDIRIEDLGDVGDLITKFDRVVEMQAVRAIAVSQTIDYLLGHPHYRDRIDPARIGGFGASLGGETMMLVAGAELTTSLLQAQRQVIRDPRLKAAVGYVPYFGQRPLPAFGRGWSGVDQVTIPYLAIGGTADTTAPLDVVRSALDRMRGSRILVALEGGQHGLDPAHVPDVFTWTVYFLDAFVGGGRASRARLTSMTSVAGGASDSTWIDYVAPTAEAPGERTVVEYHNPSLEHYFLTAEPAEAAMLDAGVVVPGWSRTGLAFKEFSLPSGVGNEVCRFYGAGPNSHFFTASPLECSVLKTPPWNAVWAYEGLAFRAILPAGERCAEGTAPVYRLYNQGKRNQPNHRYTTSRSTVAGMQREGWLLEGAVFCAAP